MIYAIIVLAALHIGWLTHPSTYSHRDGRRVAQYAPARVAVAPAHVYTREFRRYERSRLRSRNSFSDLYIRTRSR